MDPVLVANLKATLASGKAPPAAVKTGTVAGGKAANRLHERQKLLDERRKRGKLFFLDRMEADVASQHAFSQICSLRQNPDQRAMLDRELQRRIKKAPDMAGGPRIVSHSSKTLYEGQDKNTQWAPLEYY
mmetsp:Transcript_39566/g.93170  ORF Transcript_39566/g.93170 Transcript_39566/m.93170 type:complete len:130 (+) Transcript_39566:74-463(+)|eukprot:CAMPEP_0178421476 /NCGR_PEP_ID=MMETSP0689_2-20121128/26667_1 /TAXON_ID=160604 /ORGANISM="Amphidinium massartii, Strain CS-259" /LENGTH=129 /DNA_ID=CAMNT_0020042989 /DNA_START=25 /DNA_END=414 /DNA_ORIENTATION=-